MFRFIAFCLLLPVLAQAQGITPSEAEEIGTEAYIFGYPLVTMDMTRQVMTNVASPTGSKAPMGQFANVRDFPNASFKEVTAPNADTLYSVAWLDLSKEPYIIHVPDENGRYYLMPMLDGWTDVFANPGTRTTGTREGTVAILGPDWHGTLPNNIQGLKSSTNLVWILGRTYSTGTPEDYKAVHAIQDQYTLTPLSAYGKPYTPPQGKVDPNIDMKTPVKDQVNALNAEAFFTKLATLMKNNPPYPDDAPALAKFAKIGLIPGQDFDIKKLSPENRSALEKAPKNGLAKIIAHEKDAGVDVNGWIYSLKTGLYGTDYLQRAYVTLIGLGANRPQDAIYPFTTVDSEKQPLDGANKYVIHFDKGQTPPVKGFWSLTMYDDQYFFVNNPLNRYNLNSRTPFKTNLDGSIDLYVQNESPGKDKELNWLPAPKGKFILMFRYYWPDESLLNGSWKPPAVKKVK